MVRRVSTFTYVETVFCARKHYALTHAWDQYLLTKSGVLLYLRQRQSLWQRAILADGQDLSLHNPESRYSISCKAGLKVSKQSAVQADGQVLRWSWHGSQWQRWHHS